MTDVLIHPPCGHPRWVTAPAPMDAEQRAVEKAKPCPTCGHTFRTITVTLAEVPTDVLVWLASQPAGQWHTPAEIMAAVAPEGTVDAATSVVNALRLLYDAGYVARYEPNTRPRFAASENGRAAVASAT